MNPRKTSAEVLGLLIDGKLKDLKITTMKLSYRQIGPNQIQLTLYLADKEGRIISEYSGSEFVMDEFTTLNICDFEKMFEFRLS
jgi:hypothetical protein